MDSKILRSLKIGDQIKITYPGGAHQDEVLGCTTDFHDNYIVVMNSSTDEEFELYTYDRCTVTKMLNKPGSGPTPVQFRQLGVTCQMAGKNQEGAKNDKI